MKKHTKNSEDQGKKTKIVLPKVEVRELATLNEGREWPKKANR